MPRFVLILDTPGIKQYAFATDPLAEIRGASALLDRLNRQVTTEILNEFLAGVHVREVYASGGVGNYILETSGKELKSQFPLPCSGAR